MAVEKRQTILRLPEDLYKKTRYLAYLEHRSVNFEIEHALAKYIEDFERQHGTIQVPEMPKDQ